MKTLATVALTVIIVQIFSIECTHPHYSFRCLENGEIHLYGLHAHSKIISVNGSRNCNTNNITRDAGNHFFRIPNDCADPNAIKGNRNVTIAIYDPNVDGTTPSVKLSNNIVGGHFFHQFVIECKSLPDEGVNKTVVHVFQDKDYNGLPKNNMEVDDVEMRFKASQDVNSPDINTIFVGDEFFMFIKYIGRQSYSVVPKRCWANSGTVLDIEPRIDLWNRNTSAVCTPHRELLEQFQSMNETLVFAKMFGFRFSKSTYITIGCEVGIFSGSFKDLCLAKNSTRRRRGIEGVEIKTKFPVSTIRVFDNKNAYRLGNNSPPNSVDILVWIIPLFGTLFYLW